MPDIRADHTIQMKNSQAASDNGKATTSPMAKLRLLVSVSSSRPERAGSSLMRTASSQLAIPLILLNKDGRKDGKNGSGHEVARHQATVPFPVRLFRALGDLSIIARLPFEAFSPTRIVKAKAIRIKPLAGQVRATPKMLRPVAALALLLLSRPALAQEEDRVVTPLELFEPESGEGFRIAPSLVVLPSFELDATYDDNIYNIGLGEVDDLTASIRPRVTLRTELPRHRLSLSAGANIRRYAEIEAENSEQFDIQGNGVLELAERTEVVADFGFRRGIEQRGTAGDQFLTDQPVAFDRNFAGLLVRRQGGFLELLAEGRIAETNYRDTRVNGLQVDLSDRNATIKRARIRGSAPSSHYSRAFIEASVNKVSYDHSGPVQRDSDGYAVLAGLLLRLTDLINLEAGAGYIHQDFDDPAIKDVNAVNFLLQVGWTPRPDWEVVAVANRVVEPSPRLDVPAIVRSDFSLEARKAISDRVLVSAEVGIVDEKYQGSGREDQRFHASAAVHYRLTDNLGLVAQTSWREQHGNALGRDYDGFTATVGARFRF